MKYKTKIVAQNNGYVGYAILNEEVVYTSNFHKDTIMVVREISKYIAENSSQQAMTNTVSKLRSARGTSVPEDNQIPLRRNVEIFPSEEQPVIVSESQPPTPAFPPANAPRRCCGRG